MAPHTLVAPDLVTPSLLEMQSRDFDSECLQHAQSIAFRAAAQMLQYRIQHGERVTPSDLRKFVELNLAGKRQELGKDIVTPGHIASYMQSKSLTQTSIPKHLLEESWTLANTPLAENIYGIEPQQVLTKWLAQNLATLKIYASRLEKNTPSFSRTLRESATKIENTYKDSRLLKAAVEQEIIRALEREQDLDQDDNLLPPTQHG